MKALSALGPSVAGLRHRVETRAWGIAWLASRQLRSDLRHDHQVLRGPPRDRLRQFERRVFSQNGEDGILEHLVAALGITEGLAVEIGAADGHQNCTRNLIESGWSAVWVEGDASLSHESRLLFPDSRVRCIHSMVDAGSVTDLLARVGVPTEFDLLVLDVDGPDLGILRSIMNSYHPVLVVHEYNSEHRYAWECRRVGPWNYDWDYGATLESFAGVLEPAGYSLVGCESQGVNAFWAQTGRMTGPLSRGVVSELRVLPRHRAGLPGHPRRSPYRLVATDPIPPEDLSKIRFRSFEALHPATVTPGATAIFVGKVHNGMSRPASTELAPVDGPSYPVFLTYTILDAHGRELDGQSPRRTPMNAVIPAGGARPMAVEVALPAHAGAFQIAFRAVQEAVAWGDYRVEDSVHVMLS